MFYKKIAVAALIYSLFGVTLFGMKGKEEEAAAQQALEVVAAKSWDQRAVDAILTLVKTTPQERHSIAAKFADKAEYRLKFFKKTKSTEDKTSIYKREKNRLNELKFDSDTAKIKLKIKSINSAFIKIELLGLPAYVYEKPESGKIVGDVAPFVFLTPTDVLALRINVLIDLLKQNTNPTEKDAQTVVWKHFKPMAEEKIQYNVKNRSELKKLFNFRVGLIYNTELYPQNRMWCDDYLAALADYRKATTQKLGKTDEAGEGAPEEEMSKMYATEILGISLDDLDNLDEATLKLYKKILNQELEKNDYDQFVEKVQLKIEKIDKILIKKIAERSKNIPELSAEEKQETLVNKELAESALHNLRILHEGAWQKLGPDFRNEYNITLFKTVLLGAEGITSAILMGAPIAALISGVMLGVQLPVPEAIKKAVNYVEKSVNYYADFKNEFLSNKPEVDALIAEVEKLYSNYKLNPHTFNMRAVDDALADRVMRLGDKIRAGQTFLEGLNIRSTVVYEDGRARFVGFRTFWDLQDFLPNYKYGCVNMIKSFPEKIESLPKQIEPVITKAMELKSVNWQAVGAAAWSFVSIIGIPILLHYSQNALIDLVLTSPNKKIYQQYYAFLELRNNIATMNSGLDSMIKAVAPGEKRAEKERAEEQEHEEVMKSLSKKIIIEETNLEARKKHLRYVRLSFNNLEEFEALLTYWDDYCLRAIEEKHSANKQLTALTAGITRAMDEIKAANKQLQDLYDIKNIAESIKFDFKNVDLQKKDLSKQRAETIKKQVTFIKERYAPTLKIYQLISNSLDEIFKAMEAQTIESGHHVFLSNTLYNYCESTINENVTEITKKITDAAPKIAALRKICTAKELFDFKSKMVQSVGVGEGLDEAGFKITGQEVPALAETAKPSEEAASSSAPAKPATEAVKETAKSSEGAASSTATAKPVTEALPTVTVDYKAIAESDPIKNLSPELKNMLQDQRPGKWLRGWRYHKIDWDMYFIHGYLKCITGYKTTEHKQDDIYTDNVLKHLQFPYLEQYEATVAGFVKETLKPE